VIGIAQLAQHAALDAAREGFIAALAENGFVDGETVVIKLQNGQGDTNNMSTIADQFISENVDLVLAIATPAAQAVAGKTTEIPILGTAITDYEVAKLVDSNEVPGGNVSGTSDMNPVAEQIALIQKLAPDAKTIGLLYTSSEDNSRLQADMAKEAIAAAGLEFTEVTIDSSNDVQQAAQNIVSKCDAIYVPTDNIIASAMPILAEVANAAKIPVICGESNMVAAGGLATLGINYFDLGFQTGLMAVKLLNGEANISEMPIETASGFDYCINSDTAAAIGVEIPEDMKDFTVTTVAQ